MHHKYIYSRVVKCESLLIQEHKPELNANIPSMPLCIFNRASCLTYDITHHHHWHISSRVTLLPMLCSTTLL